MLIQNTGRVRHHCLSRGHSRHCLYSSDSRRPRPLRVTVSPTNNWTGLGHEQKAVKSQFKNIIYFANCSIYSNAKKKIKQKLTCPPLITFYLLHHTYSSCFFSRHRFIIITAQLGRTQHAIVLAARRHDDGGSVPLSWPSEWTVLQNTSRLIYTERSCHWWFLVWSSEVWPLKNILFTDGLVKIQLQQVSMWTGT